MAAVPPSAPGAPPGGVPCLLPSTSRRSRQRPSSTRQRWCPPWALRCPAWSDANATLAFEVLPDVRRGNPAAFQLRALLDALRHRRQPGDAPDLGLAPGGAPDLVADSAQRP